VPKLVASSSTTGASQPEHRALSRVSDKLGGYIAIGFIALLLLAGGLGGWAATSELAGAVIAEGTVVVDSNVKKVQHPTGGIVGRIFVRDGDRVTAGDLVLRLDDTITRANLQLVIGQLDELEIRGSRLVAERDGKLALEVPTALISRMTEPGMIENIHGEQALFESRNTARAGQKAQLVERIVQLHKEVEGIEAQQQAKDQEIDLLQKELLGLFELEKKNLVPSLKMTNMQREGARLKGARAQLMASAAQTRGKIAETELQVLQIDQDLKTEVMKELREIQSKRAELNERRVTAEDQLRRIELRAPQAGIVHQMSVHTIGGVINPSEPVLLIVPEEDALVIEAKVAPQYIDHVRSGQTAFIRFPAFNQRTTPEFLGTVHRVAADLSKEPELKQAYFVTRISLSPDELMRMGTLKLVPGMPAEVHIKTTERTALSYLMKPLSDQIARAFTEQ
jgi:membrane fusion protein, type I secretion system